jgi:hypothetical protein
MRNIRREASVTAQSLHRRLLLCSKLERYHAPVVQRLFGGRVGSFAHDVIKIPPILTQEGHGQRMVLTCRETLGVEDDGMFTKVGP